MIPFLFFMWCMLITSAQGFIISCFGLKDFGFDKWFFAIAIGWPIAFVITAILTVVTLVTQ